MKKMTISLVICLNISCLFPLESKIFSTYKIDENSILQLVYMDTGATTENVVEVRKKTRGHTVVMERIVGLDDSDKIDYKKINDTLLTITFTDTTYFKGNFVEHTINLNHRID